MNKNVLFATLMGLVLVMVARPAMAQLSAQKGPLDINANHLEIYDEKNMAIYDGRVDAVQDGVHLRANRLEIYFAEAAANTDDTSANLGASFGAVERIVAVGEVYYVTPDRVVRCDRAVYSLKNDQIVMDGNVVVTQGENVIRSSHLTININTGKAVFNAAVKGTTPKKRVHSVFYPQEDKKDDAEPVKETPVNDGAGGQ